jgi:2-oxoglutarate/2-oxoacid ferredoxin oxidoreductase subunit alpha
MSDTMATASSPGGAPKVSSINEAVIRIAGNSQDGIQAIGGFLARLAGRSEQEVMTFMTIPSTISGGPSIFQVRIGSGEVLSAGDDADVLLAFYQHSYEDHIGSLKKNGIVLYDTDHVEPKPEWQKDYHHVGIPISSLTIEAIGGTAKDKGKNIYALGLIARMFDLNVTGSKNSSPNASAARTRALSKTRWRRFMPAIPITSAICWRHSGFRKARSATASRS